MTEHRFDIAEMLDVKTSATCEVCGRQENVHMIDDVLDAAEVFHRDGWRVKDDKLQCKACARKRKPKKK